MDISFDCERIANAINGMDANEAADKIGKAFMECMATGHKFFSNSLDLNATEYMLQAIHTVQKPVLERKRSGRPPKAQKPAWTTEGKTHEQMLKEKMAMMIEESYGSAVAPPKSEEPQRKRRGRRPKNSEAV